MLSLDYTHQGKRPSTRQILADWKRAGKPAEFAVEYGETFGRFELYLGRWVADGNGCHGFKLYEVLDRLNADERNEP
jgi:hypothetical protein